LPGLPETSINERAQHFLRVLIERYILDGQPVGSRTLAKDSGLDLSPATIRNVMADLEDAGLIISPHTSAGRIPTANGYRMFVDALIASQNVDQKLLRSISQEFQVSDTKVRSYCARSAKSFRFQIKKVVTLFTPPLSCSRI